MAQNGAVLNAVSLFYGDFYRPLWPEKLWPGPEAPFLKVLTTTTQALLFHQWLGRVDESQIVKSSRPLPRSHLSCTRPYPPSSPARSWSWGYPWPPYPEPSAPEWLWPDPPHLATTYGQTTVTSASSSFLILSFQETPTLLWNHENFCYVLPLFLTPTPPLTCLTQNHTAVLAFLLLSYTFSLRLRQLTCITKNPLPNLFKPNLLLFFGWHPHECPHWSGPQTTRQPLLMADCDAEHHLPALPFLSPFTL